MRDATAACDPTVIFLHTSDLHGRLDRVVAQIRALRRSHPDALWVDSGDAMRAWNVSLGLVFEDTLARMTREGCLAMAMGNREFELLAPGMRAKLRGAGFPVLCSNLVHPNPTRVPVRSEVRVRTASGMTITFLGALRNMVSGWLAEWISPFRFEDPVEAIGRRAMSAPREDLLVVLSHLGHEMDVILLREIPRISVVFGGHSHRAWCERVGPRLAVAPEPHGASLGMVRLAADGAHFEMLPIGA